ncbi:MAG TPA: acetyl-CoA carboxylase biotin carboxylase subunit [Candidatus Eremiobacteraceae bacterium]|nr:acetyl-CoA carboxylase biotin carboxylase subunit [Candidatus Eremiobacteraceae bacterium]
MPTWPTATSSTSWLGRTSRGWKRSVSFKRVLVANRGEIALRVIRACRELALESVAVYSDADRDSLHVRAADAAYYLGPTAPAESYLNVDRLLAVAREAGCDAVHPGYGFLAENAAFSRRCRDGGFVLIGPNPDVMEQMGDKIAARRCAQAAGFPIVPGTTDPVQSVAQARALAERFGYPIAIKAAAGGGGKGLKVARDASELEQALSLATKEAAAYFKDGTVYVERYLAHPKHVEIQILGDRHGHVVHLGERDCSLQRRHQKLVEETPASIGSDLRRRMHAAAVALGTATHYDSAGTIECLVDGEQFFFLEMNTRIQVEHTISEAVYGFDLVKAQIRIAAGEQLWIGQGDLHARGHAIECRINAESPAQGFRPCPGTVTRYIEPGGPGVRIDGAAFPGWRIPGEYDSLVAKLVVWGADREEAIQRTQRALHEYVVEGFDTTIPLYRMLLDDPGFRQGSYSTATVERFVREQRDALARAYKSGAAASAQQEAVPNDASIVSVEVNAKRFEVKVFGLPPHAGPLRRTPKYKAPKHVSHDGSSVPAPMHGIIAEIKVKPGDLVADGQVVAIIEAMKMMNEVAAPRAGRVESVAVAVGETVETGTAIILFGDAT